ncbi:hypothetical protein ACW69C_22290 [Streptomyces sp. MN3]|uniref:hypothetical protein n=1 Tax=Streptomyces sp. yara TaxID=3458421 RepID=UPI0040403D70
MARRSGEGAQTADSASPVRVAITPDPDEVADVMRAGPSTDPVALLLRQVHARMEADRAGYLALLELRLEGTRRPELGREQSKNRVEVLGENVRFHLEAHLPGGRTGVVRSTWPCPR